MLNCLLKLLSSSFPDFFFILVMALLICRQSCNYNVFVFFQFVSISFVGEH